MLSIINNNREGESLANAYFAFGAASAPMAISFESLLTMNPIFYVV